MKCWMMSWLLLPNRSASSFFPAVVSNRYFFSILTQGRARRSAATRSRMRVSAFSLRRCALRAAIHSSCETILCGCMLGLLGSDGFGAIGDDVEDDRWHLHALVIAIQRHQIVE